MGAKARVIPGFLDRVLEEEVEPGGTVVDLMCGTGIVAAFCAGRYRVFANDAQAYAQVIAKSLIEHDPKAKRAFLRCVDIERDLLGAYKKNQALLEARYAPALELEEKLLGSFQAGDDGPSWCERYRKFLDLPGSVHASPRANGARAEPYENAQDLLSEGSIARYRDDPHLRPACLATAYYANIYFGLRQAMVLDSIRAAIDDMDSTAPFAAEKKAHYLSALLHAASLSTSGTSHFAQPRHLTKDSELRAMAARRGIDVLARFEAFSSEILSLVDGTMHLEGNRSFAGDYRRFIEEDTRRGARRARFRFPGDIDLVYLDPPYTADHYSRFYHVLEVLTRYDYPVLDRDPSGRVLRGRYPRLEHRFQSGFCRPGRVEEEFRQVIEAASGSSAKLVISYASPTGLLLKEYAKRSSKADPVRSLEDLCRESYRDVSTRRLSMMHSGQGDSNLHIEELLVICRKPCK
jgi:adenine-specific DNA methylase